MSKKAQPEKKNLLLEPKWKQRTHDTHKKHLELYKGKDEIKVAFLGDSMMERWLSTGKPLWDSKFKEYANLGVGGDGIEHLLYRLNKNGELDGILDVVKQLDKIIFQIGTNNIEKKSVDHVLEGTINIIKLIFQKQPQCELVVYGLLNRTDIPNDKIKELNTKLEDYIKSQNNPKLTYRFFGDKVNNDNKFFDDHVHLSALGYGEWFSDLDAVL